MITTVEFSRMYSIKKEEWVNASGFLARFTRTRMLPGKWCIQSDWQQYELFSCETNLWVLSHEQCLVFSYAPLLISITVCLLADLNLSRWLFLSYFWGVGTKHYVALIVDYYDYVRVFDSWYWHTGVCDIQGCIFLSLHRVLTFHEFNSIITFHAPITSCSNFTSFIIILHSLFLFRLDTILLNK